MPRNFVTMFHPKAGTMQCAPHAVRIHQRNGWEVVDGPEPVAVAAAGGGDVLTTGTVFPPESFDDDTDVDELTD